MEIIIRSAGSTVIVKPMGNITLDTVKFVQDVVGKLIDSECRQAIFDLSKTEMVMSTGISFFIQSKDQLNESGAKLTLTNLHKDFASALKVLELMPHFNIAESIALALEPTGRQEKDFHVGLPTGAGQKHVESDAAEPIRMDAETIDDIVRHHVPSRLAIDIVDWYVTHNHSIGEAEKIAAALKQKVKPVKKMMVELSKRHVLKKMGGGTYNYSPERELHLKLKEFFFRWHCPTEHGRIMSAVLKHEL